MRSKQKLYAVIGVVLLIIGAFLPVYDVNAEKSVEFLENGNDMGIKVLLAAIIAGVFIFFNKLNWLKYVSFFVCCIMWLSVLNYFYTKKDIDLEYKQFLERITGEPIVNLTSFSWGWIVLLIGIGLLIYSSYIENASYSHLANDAK